MIAVLATLLLLTLGLSRPWAPATA